MAIIVELKPTVTAAQLTEKIYKAIDSGKVLTWQYDSFGDFTHIPNQWLDKAWLRPHSDTRELRVGIIGVQSVTLTRAVYGVYHGRFIEMLVTHFPSDFTTARATAQAIGIDIFT